MRTNNTLFIIVCILAVLFAVWWFGNEPLYNYIQKDLKKENEALKLEIEDIKSYKQKEIEVIRYITDKKQDKKDENTTATNAVYTLNEREIDSTIRTHKHTSRN